MSFLKPSDFIGLVEQSTNKHTTPKIQLYIDQYEVVYLTDLLGSAFYDEFIADLLPTPAVPTSVPQDAKFLAFFDPFAIDDGESLRVSEGIKRMLEYFIMFEYARDNQYDFALTGATKNTFSNAEIAKLNNTNADRNYNLGITTYKEIQWFIDDNPNNADYDLENMQRKEFLSWL